MSYHIILVLLLHQELRYPFPYYLSAFFFSFTEPNKQLPNAKSVFKFFNHGVSL